MKINGFQIVKRAKQRASIKVNVIKNRSDEIIWVETEMNDYDSLRLLLE